MNTQATDWKSCAAQGRTWGKTYKKQLWEHKNM